MDDYEESDHILDNMTSEEELGLSIFMQAISSGEITPATGSFQDISFLRCLTVAERITDLLRLRHPSNEGLKVVPFSRKGQ